MAKVARENPPAGVGPAGVSRVRREVVDVDNSTFMEFVDITTHTGDVVRIPRAEIENNTYTHYIPPTTPTTVTSGTTIDTTDWPAYTTTTNPTPRATTASVAWDFSAFRRMIEDAARAIAAPMTGMRDLAASAARDLAEARQRAAATMPCNCDECVAARSGAGDPFYSARTNGDGGEVIALEEAARVRVLTALSRRQLDDWRRGHYWDLTGPVTGHTYRITQGSAGNIYRHHDRMRLCLAHPSPYVPTWVAMECQLWLLLHDEARFLRLANALGEMPYLPGSRAALDAANMTVGIRGI